MQGYFECVVERQVAKNIDGANQYSDGANGTGFLTHKGEMRQDEQAQW